MLARESTVSNELREASFSTFKAETKEEHEAKEFAIKQAKEYLNGITGNTLIMGNPGTGKSHLCYSMAKAINEGYKSRNEPKSVLFVSITEIITRIQSDWQYRQSDFTEYDALKLLTEVDYLFIDDLGTESVMNSQMKLIIGYRPFFSRFLISETQLSSTPITTEKSWPESIMIS